MKYGVLVCKNTENIGDDIQSYAAACLLPEVDYYIEREHMDIFRPKEEEPVNAIINGWLMNNKLGWPVSACINPLYLSMHFLKEDAMLVGDSFLGGIGGKDLKAHAPVGARDISTQRLLERNGIPSYFSGCLTLTLPRKFRKEVVQPYVCLTDVSDEAAEYVKNRYPNLMIRMVEHEPEKLPALVDNKADWNGRFRKVEELLAVYQNASAVVTTRLHCAMPCLALGTPVLLLKDDDLYEPTRMDGLSELVYSATTSDFVMGKTSFDLENPPENPNRYMNIRNTLIQTVKDYIEENGVCTPELKERFHTYDSQWEARALWKNDILLDLARRHNIRWNQTHDEFEKIEAGRHWLEQRYHQLTQENNDLQNWCAEQEKGKQWLEDQNDNLIQENTSLRSWCSEQEKAKTWLGAQNKELSQEAVRLRERVSMLESELQSIPRIVRRLAKKSVRR